MDATLPAAERRRSQRLAVSIPVFVTSQDLVTKLQSRCDTIDVSSTGARLYSRRLLPFGVSVRIDVLWGRGIATGRVVRVHPVHGGYAVGVHLDGGGNIWNIKHPPASWK